MLTFNLHSILCFKDVFIIEKALKSLIIKEISMCNMHRLNVKVLIWDYAPLLCGALRFRELKLSSIKVSAKPIFHPLKLDSVLA